jgi:ubiquinol-cytochrome c reductase cytochrome b subunit
LYTLHILLLPLIILALIVLHLMFVIIHKHTQYPGPGRTENNVVGYPVLPVYAAKAGGFFFLVFGVVVLIAATVTINPIWSYGPYDPSPVSAGTQPDWYIGFADGALRLMPPGLETYWFGYTWSWNIIIPVLILLVFLAVVFAYPFIEAWVTGDKREHHLLDRPRNAPVRTAIGAAGVLFYAVLWAGAASDIIATHFRVTMEGVINTLQILLILGPIFAFMITKRVCLGLQKKDREIVLHGFETGRIVRLPGGEYTEVHQQLNDYDRWQLVSFNDNAPIMVRPNERGKITGSMRRRAAVSRFFFEDRIAPVTKTEYKEALEHVNH